jgi:hypothetical protein
MVIRMGDLLTPVYKLFRVNSAQFPLNLIREFEKTASKQFRFDAQVDAIAFTKQTAKLALVKITSFNLEPSFLITIRPTSCRSIQAAGAIKTDKVTATRSQLVGTLYKNNDVSDESVIAVHLCEFAHAAKPVD